MCTGNANMQLKRSFFKKRCMGPGSLVQISARWGPGDLADAGLGSHLFSLFDPLLLSLVCLFFWFGFLSCSRGRLFFRVCSACLICFCWCLDTLASEGLFIQCHLAVVMFCLDHLSF